MALVADHLPPPDRSSIERRVRLAQDELLAHGLVGAHDMGQPPLHVEAMDALARAGELRCRMTGYLWANEGLDPAALGRFPREQDLDPASRYRVIGAKLMVDGALGSRGALLFADYDDEAGQRGLQLLEEEVLAEHVDAAADAGLQPAIHAIGDRANRIVLDVLERRLAADPGLSALRPRVEHAQIVAREDWPRFRDLGVIISMQPTHATSDMSWIERRLGEERTLGSYAWRRLGGEGAVLAFGSDFPIESPDPLRGLYAARTRRDEAGAPPGGWLADQCLDARAALAAFTRGAAHAALEEDVRGHLHPGCFADMTVLDVDPLSGEPAELLEARVLATVVDGEVAFGGER